MKKSPYKKGTLLQKKSIDRANDKTNDEVRMGFDQILHQLENGINNSDFFLNYN